MPLVVTRETFRGVPLLRLSGSLVQEQDISALRAAAAGVADTRHAAMVLDLSALKALDFAGLGVLLELGGLAGSLFLLGTPEAVRAKMIRARVDSLFSLAADEAELHQAMDAAGVNRGEVRDA